jgi:ATP-dependent Clp protease adaptor protein ClpS
MTHRALGFYGKFDKVFLNSLSSSAPGSSSLGAARSDSSGSGGGQEKRPGFGPGREPGQDHEEEADVALESVDDPELKEPRKYAVLLHNDDYTTMEFVIDVLKRFFRKTEQEAMEITMRVHHTGSGLAGIYSYDIAETKVAQVTEYARDNGHPLKCTAEPAE